MRLGAVCEISYVMNLGKISASVLPPFPPKRDMAERCELRPFRPPRFSRPFRATHSGCTNKYLPGINDRRRRRSMPHLSKLDVGRMPLDVACAGRVWKEIYFRSCDSLSNLVVCSVTLGRLTISAVCTRRALKVATGTFSVGGKVGPPVAVANRLATTGVA